MQPNTEKPKSQTELIMSRLRSPKMLKNEFEKMATNVKILIASRVLIPLIFLILSFLPVPNSS